MCLYWPSTIVKYNYTGPRNIMTGALISGIELPGWMNHNSSCIPSMAVSVYAVFSWASLGPVVTAEHIMKAVDNLNITAYQLNPYMVSVFSTGNGVLQQAALHVTILELCWSSSRNIMLNSS